MPIHSTDLNATARQVVDISIRAGKEILRIYQSNFSVRRKSNDSPVTEADIAANDVILSSLNELSPDIPIISEESHIPAFSERSCWQRFWLIDPLDGTRSFVRGGGQFTVNIALIEGNYPILGVVHSPVEQKTYWGTVNSGAFRIDGDGDVPVAIHADCLQKNFIRIIAPKSRLLKAVQEFKNNLESSAIGCEVSYSSSSIKFCRIAEGAADIYPNFGPTSEWDTAAAQCVLERAGGSVIDLDGSRVKYNKSDQEMKNPLFLAMGAGQLEWRQFLPNI